MKKFGRYYYNTPDFKINFIHNGLQMLYTYLNGYTASVVQHDHSYGGKDNLWEVAVMFEGNIVYDTPVTGDVIGFMTLGQVAVALVDIANLPDRANDAPHPSETHPAIGDIMDKW